MYQGYLQLGDVEIGNANRVAAYVRNLAPQFPLRNCVECEELEAAIRNRDAIEPPPPPAPSPTLPGPFANPNVEFDVYGFRMTGAWAVSTVGSVPTGNTILGVDTTGGGAVGTLGYASLTNRTNQTSSNTVEQRVFGMSSAVAFVTPGTTFPDLRFWARCSGADLAGMATRVAWWSLPGGAGAQVGAYTNGPTVTVTSSWVEQKLGVPATAPEGAMSMTLEIYSTSATRLWLSSEALETDCWSNGAWPRGPLGPIEVHPLNFAEPAPFSLSDYTTPHDDGAAWIDPAVPASRDFYGFYPLEVQGVGGSTRTAPVVESIIDGGWVGAGRSSTREIRVRGMLVGRTAQAARAGAAWLQNSLEQACSQNFDGCRGATLQYFLECPTYDEHTFAEKISSNIETPLPPLGFEVIPIDSIVPGAYQGVFHTPSADGAVVQWGRTSEAGQFVETQGPVMLQRTNWMRNPSFHARDARGNLVATAAFWTGVNATLTPISGAAALDGVASVLVTRTVDSGGTFGGIQSRPTQSAAGPLRVSALMAIPPGLSYSTLDVQMYVEPDTGGVWQQETFTLTTTPTVFTMEVSNPPAGMQVRIGVSDLLLTEGIFIVDQVIVENTALNLPYFDGDSNANEVMHAYRSAVQEINYRAAWIPADGGPDSYSQIYGPSELFTTEQPNSNWQAWINVTEAVVEGARLGIQMRQVAGIEEQYGNFERHLYDVSLVEGVSEIEVLDDARLCAAAIIVDFTLVAATPFAWSRRIEAIPMPPAPEISSTTLWPQDNCASLPPGWWTEDPFCEPTPAPPSPIPGSFLCTSNDVSWQRRLAVIPSGTVPDWASVVPTINLWAGSDIHNLRIRFYPIGPATPIPDALFTRTNLAINPGFRWDTFSFVRRLNGVQSATDIIVPDWAPPNDPFGHVEATVGAGTNVLGIVNLETASEVGETNRVTPGASYTFSANIAANFAGSDRIAIEWISSTGSVISTSAADFNGMPVSADFRTHSVTATAPSTAFRGRLVIQRTTLSGSAGGTIWVNADNFLFERTQTIDPRFFDGATAWDDRWAYGWLDTTPTSLAIASQFPVDPCSFIGEVSVSYLAGGSHLTIDGPTRYASSILGSSEPAAVTNLLFSGEGGPVDWPVLSCGQSYLVSIDIPVEWGQSPLALGISLTRRE